MFKRVLLSLALTFALPSLALAADAPKKEEKAAKKDEATYTCPMGCDGHEQKGPGSCPKCGMDLVKKEGPKK